MFYVLGNRVQDTLAALGKQEENKNVQIQEEKIKIVIFLSGVQKVIPPGERASDRFAWHAKRAKNTLQPTQRSSLRMPRRKPAGLVGFPDTGGRRADALEGVPGRSR
jgi:hypothetical protein